MLLTRAQAAPTTSCYTFGCRRRVFKLQRKVRVCSAHSREKPGDDTYRRVAAMNGPSWGKAGAVRESMFLPPSPRAANELAPFVFEIETAGFYQYVSTDV